MGAVLREPPQLTDADFAALRDLLSRETGIKLSGSKQAMVYRRLNRRLGQLDLPDFRDYLERLRTDPAERQRAVDALTTNLTGFFREPHHFELLAGELKTSAQLWSAGCSTGEEAWSLAMVAAERLPLERVSVLGTDINAAVLETARAGIYPLEDALLLDPGRRERWLLRGRGERAGLARIKPELAARVRFLHANLHERWPVGGPFDAIFCRNVLIYFDQAAQELLLERFWRALAPQGLLCLGHSESVLPSDRFTWLGHTAYRRRP